MVWDQLSINKPHLVYIILGGFTSIFMLVSLFIKEKLYIGEATVATICGLIFGPHAANLINPLTWGNTDQITLEFSRIVLVVQCFAVGVELPKAYMERHWLSVVLLLVPVMTFGWLVTSLFIWWMILPLTWLESLCAAACVTATDPVLASSVVGKGKFAKRVPKHIRDLLSAESGCNDGMAFPFIYLALYLIHYHLDAKHVVQHWICNTILYECIWGAVYGVLVGYIARQAIKLAERKGIIDRESFLVFYFVLALFCAGSGAMLGMDDLLIGFAAGVGFSNDGWFLEKTEESHVSNVIDLLLNLTYFVYLGTIIPWDQYNSGAHGLEAWRLVVIALMVIFFRRIPIMLLLKPIIPDIKTWREALFCGHFGPIGVGAIFVAILARAELENNGTTPLAQLPDPSDAEYVLIYTIWPITTFLVMSSIVVHGSSVAVFTLGKRINTLTMTLSYTTGNDQSSSWMNRLPRVSSIHSKSMGRSFTSDMSEDEKDFPPGQLPPVGIPKLQLRRQKEEEYGQPPQLGIRTRKRRGKKKSEYGGPISDSAITPQRSATHSEPNLAHQESGSDTLYEKSERPSPERVTSDQTVDSQERNESSSDEGVIKKSRPRPSIAPDEVRDAEVEVYEEKDHLVIEDEEGNVVTTVDSHGMSREEKMATVEEARRKVRKDKSGYYAKHKHESHSRDEEDDMKKGVEDAVEHPEKNLKDHFRSWKGFGFGGGNDGDASKTTEKKPERKRGPAHAYQYGNTIIVEDEDGEVIHKYEIPGVEGERKYKDGLKRMSTWVGLGGLAGGKSSNQPAPSGKPADTEAGSSAVVDKEKAEEGNAKASAPGDKPTRRSTDKAERTDDGLRMVISNAEQYGLTGLRKPKASERRPSIQGMAGGRRMSTQDFIRQMQQLDRESRQHEMDQQGIHKEAQRHIHDSAEDLKPSRGAASELTKQVSSVAEEPEGCFSAQKSSRGRSGSDAAKQRPGPTRTQSSKSQATDDEEDEDIPVHDVRGTISRHGKGNMTSAEARRQRHLQPQQSAQDRIEEDDEEDDPNEETAAERRRRLAALGLGGADSDSSSDEEPREIRAVQEPTAEPERPAPAQIRRPLEARPPPRAREVMAEPPRMRVQWGSDTIGAVRGKGGDDEEAQGGPGQRESGGGFGKKFKGFLNK